jgi:hypothetical protein
VAQLFSLGRLAHFMSKRITQIPFPGSSGQTPTGAMQFQGDWPGLFIRGDSAIDMASKIRHLQQRLSDTQDGVVALSLGVLGKFADIIERDVQMRKEDL